MFDSDLLFLLLLVRLKIKMVRFFLGCYVIHNLSETHNRTKINKVYLLATACKLLLLKPLLADLR